MSTSLLPPTVLQRYLVEERWHSCAILAADFPSELQDILECLDQFKLLRSEITAFGGRKTKIADRFDDLLKGRGWSEKSATVRLSVDDVERKLETHSVDLWKDRIAVEVEWNNKDPFFSRDLNAFRLLHELGIISVGVIITRADELQELFGDLGYAWDRKNKQWKRISEKYGESTTHWGKLMPRVESGGAGTCPLLLFAIRTPCYEDDMPETPVIRVKPTEPPPA